LPNLNRIHFAPVFLGVSVLLLAGGFQVTRLSSANRAASLPVSPISARALAALPAPPIPPDNLQSVDELGFPVAGDPKVELGKLLFYDNRLSGDASISCFDCHSDEFGWTDGGDLCRGYAGTSHWRNCQTLVNAAYFGKLFWDGSSNSLEAQAVSAASGGVSGNGERDTMEERIRQVPDYVTRFNAVFGTVWPNLEDAWRAIAAFERTLVQPDTPFDRYMRGDMAALSEEAQAGMALFEGKAACIQCHDGPLLTDEKYYNLGVPENPAFEFDQSRQITFRYEQYAKGVPEEIYRKTKSDLGLYYRTKRMGDMGKFRSAPLRYLMYTAPYMHNGAFYTLEEVVEFYNAGGGEDQIKRQFDIGTKSPLVQPLGLTSTEQRQLVAFLESTSGSEIRMERPVLPQYGVFDPPEPTGN
jgi:cytochrome c peroxidase